MSSFTGKEFLSFVEASTFHSNISARKLKPGARPVQSAGDKGVISSAADSRLTVYQTVDLAKQFW
jgi:phosphatidylserine decarboxylase